MLPADSNVRWLGRSGYAIGAAAFAAFLVYGSLVPLSFRFVPLASAIQQFQNVLNARLVLEARSDFVSNILLGVPLGYLTMAALLTDRRGIIRKLFASILTVLAGVTIAVLAEFSQVFFGRIDSLSDIVAQGIGSVLGVSTWLVVGEAVTGWLRETAAERHQSAMAQRILLGYCVVFVLSQLMPFDLTINLGELARKYRRGQILITPFTYQHATMFEMWWDYLGDVALNAPFGAAGVLLFTRDGSRRRPLWGLVIGVALVAAIELAQVFVGSRFADVTDLLTGSAGVVIGVLLTGAISNRIVSTPTVAGRSASVRWFRVALLVWIVALASYHWNPFDFTASAARITAGMHQLRAVPFYSYYLGTEFHAFTEALRKFLLGMPLGPLLFLSWRPRSAHVGSGGRQLICAVIAFGVFLVIEIGQVFLPTRTPDVTDALIAEMGAVSAMWMTNRLALMGPARVGHDSPPRVAHPS